MFTLPVDLLFDHKSLALYIYIYKLIVSFLHYQVEHVLFPDLQGYNMVLPAMDMVDHKVLLARRNAAQLLKINCTGPETYVSPHFYPSFSLPIHSQPASHSTICITKIRFSHSLIFIC